jgi:thiol-disulfide isomerase/thioredoxin
MTTTAPGYKSSNGRFILVVVAIVALGLLAVAFLAVNRDSAITDEVRDAAATSEVTIDGDGLTPLPEGVGVTDPATDAEAGNPAPTLTGTGFDDGGEVTIGADGRAKAVYFLAHWCPHCQAELPLVQELIEEGQVPEGLDVYAVSTAVDDTLSNYPPGVWLAREGFERPVIRDDAASSAYAAYGGSGFPYVVYLDGENQVVARSAGELGKDAIAAMWALTVDGSSG